MSSSRKRLTLKEKVEVIRVRDNEKLSVRGLSTKFSVGKTQISDILKKRNEILKAWSTNENQESKRVFPKTQGLIIDNLTFEWFCRARANRIPLSGTIIREKALEIAKNLGDNEFKASLGWLEKFRIRHNISYKTVSGEVGSVDGNVVSEWNKKLETLCEGYEEKDIYNCDETALFFRALPDKTMTLKGEKCSGGKLNKERLTVMLAVNMIGEFEEPFIIGKAAKPRCFKGVNINSLNVEWHSNKRAWMTRDLMSEWLINFDRKMKRQNRRVCLFLDNAASHPDIMLENVKLIFFPPNVTSVCQPLDQGVIKNFKVFYRKLILRHILSKIDQVESADELARGVSVLDAVLWIRSAVKKVTKGTVYNCFVKAGFKTVQAIELEPNEDLIGDELRDLVGQFEGVDAAEFAVVDNAVCTEDSTTNVAELVSSLKDGDDRDENENEEETAAEEELVTVSNKEVFEHIKKLKQYFIQESDSEGLKLICDVEIHTEKNRLIKKCKQTKISDFFQ